MSQSLARYHARCPRYILNTEDDDLIRIAGPSQIPWEEDTEIKNVSLTGLAFTAPEDLCPLLGEVIKIQFLVPGGMQMACYAIVTRLEEDKPGIVSVAVHFHRLEMAHRIVLAQGLSRRFRDQMSRRNQLELSAHIPVEKTRWNWMDFPAVIMLFCSLWLWASLTQLLVNSSSIQAFWKTLVTWLA